MFLKHLIRLLLLTAVLCLLLGTAFAEKTVVMLYMCGSDLESKYGMATWDLEEILSSGYDKNETEVLILSGGSRMWWNGQDPDIPHLCRISSGNTLVDLQVTERIMNMGDPDTLSWFLTYSRENYSADRYALILWDHGGGPLRGVCWDEHYDDERLTLSELTDALKNSPFREEKLEWIGFDACLMASLEVADQISPYAHFMIASQEREPGSGWEYSFLQGIEEDADGGATGRRIIDAYLEDTANRKADKTLSCVDLNMTGDLSEALESFFEVRKQKISADSFPELSQMRQASKSFGLTRAVDNNSYDLVDLGELLTQLQADESLLQILKKTVIYTRSNINGASGLCVYHPLLNTRDYEISWKSLYGKVGFSESYTSYIQSFAGILTGERLIYWNNLYTETAEAENEFTCQLTEEQASSMLQGRMCVMGKELEDGVDDSWYLIYTTDQITLDDQNILHGTYPGKSLYLVDGAGQFEITQPIEYQVYEGNYYIPLYPCDENQEILDTILGIYTLDPETDTLVLKEYLIYDWTLGNFTSRAEIDFSSYAGIIFERYSRNIAKNEYGEILATPYWPRDYHVSTQMYYPSSLLNFRFIAHDEYEGIIQVLFEIQDVQNNWIASRPVQVSDTVSPLEISLNMEQDERLEVRPFGYADNSRFNHTTPLGMVIKNLSDTRMTVQLSDTHFNGIPLDVIVGVSIAPGESGVLPFSLDLTWLPWLRPQRTLREVSGTFASWAEGDEEHARKVPYSMSLEMSLASMYRSTTALPEENADWAEPMRVAEGEDWSVSVLGISSLDGYLVLTMEYENKSELELYFCPADVKADGNRWNHGAIQFSTLSGYDGNGLRILPGQSEYAPSYLNVPAGETLIDYVQFVPEERPCALNELVFRIHLFDPTAKVNLLTEEIMLSFADSVMVAENVSSATDFDEVASSYIAGEERYGINNYSINPEVEAPGLSRNDLITLSLPHEPEGTMDAYYFIAFLIDNEDELYDRHIFINTSDRQTTGLNLSRTPVMIPLQSGKLARTDGKLQAVCIPWIVELTAGGEDSLTLDMASAWTEESGLLYQESLVPVSFFSSGSGYFPDQVSEISIGLMPEYSTAFFSGALWYKYGAPGDLFDALRINGTWSIIPDAAWTEDTDSTEWSYVEGYQNCGITSDELRIRLRKPTERDHLYILYEVRDAEGNLVKLPPVPLAEYLLTDSEFD